MVFGGHSAGGHSKFSFPRPKQPENSGRAVRSASWSSRRARRSPWCSGSPRPRPSCRSASTAAGPKEGAADLCENFPLHGVFCFLFFGQGRGGGGSQQFHELWVYYFEKTPHNKISFGELGLVESTRANPGFCMWALCTRCVPVAGAF